MKDKNANRLTVGAVTLTDAVFGNPVYGAIW